jgi:hypothetical protein
MENYLKTEYGFIDESSWLKTEEDIVKDYTENGHEHFDCGQGYHDEEVTIKVLIGNGKYYEVYMEADEVERTWMDRGDKMHNIESIHNVTFKEVEKPEPKERGVYELLMTNMTEDQYLAVKAFADKIQEND